jgi:4-alpha-glucanotransferase
VSTQPQRPGRTAGKAGPALFASPKAAVSLHFTSLPGPFGCGDIADAASDFLDNLKAMGIKAWQVLPVGPTAYGDSPYQPLSVFAGNEMLIGLEPLQRAGALSEDELAPLRALPEAEVDFARLIPLKWDLLKRAAQRFADIADLDILADYQAFLQQQGPLWLDDYALFRVLKTAHAERSWQEWPAGLSGRDPAALNAARREHAGELELLKVIQYFFDRQWRVLRQRARDAGVLLFGDMPIYMALDSADAWANPELLLLDKHGKPAVVAGVPPDYFSADGQLWGNPLYNWTQHASSGFAWWVARLRAAMARFDLLRIDHFRGFETYWAVPAADTTARDGQWCEGPGDALFEALRSALGPLPIVAEDLGLITPAVDELRARHGIPGMKVLQFELAEAGFDPANISPDCVLYTGTHDNDTLAGWFEGSESDTRSAAEVSATQARVLALAGAEKSAVPAALIRLALHSPAQLVVVPMQDWLGLGSAARMNTPGSTLNNWRWRLQSEQLGDDFRNAVRSAISGAKR